jgi:hypothetical protein
MKSVANFTIFNGNQGLYALNSRAYPDFVWLLMFETEVNSADHRLLHELNNHIAECRKLTALILIASR